MKKKRCIILFMIAALLITGYTGALAEDDYVMTDISAGDALHTEAESLIAALLGHTQRGVTRAAFVSDAVELSKYDIYENITVQDFKDVPPNSELAPYIHSGVEAGLIAAGDEFRPNDTITFDEALKIVVQALGYGEFAERMGGFPAGYRNIADRADILTHIKASEEYLTEENALILLLNMLNAKPVEYKSSTEQAASDETFLEKYYNVKSAEGILTQTFSASLYTSDFDKKGSRIKVDGETYSVTDGRYYAELLGHKVNIYYNEDMEIVSLTPDEDNKTVSFAVKDAAMSSGLQVEFKGGAKSKSFKLNDDFITLYNGLPAAMRLKDYLPETDGSLLLIDNDDDGKYNVAVIKAVSYIVVKDIAREARLIYDLNSSENTIDLSDPEGVYSINSLSGTERLVDVKSDAVYEVYASEDKSVISMNILENTAAGEIGSLLEDKVIVDGKEYKTTAYFESCYRSGIKAGDEGVFTLSSDGRLVSFVKSDSDMMYAFMVKIAEDNDNDSVIFAKLFDEKGKLRIIELDDKVIIDGMSYRKENVCGMPQFSLHPDGQLIRFGEHNGKLKLIDTAEENDGMAWSSEKPQNNSLTHYTFRDEQGEAINTFFYKSVANVMSPKNLSTNASLFNVASSKVFVVPNDTSDTDGYRITNYSFFTDLESKSGMEIYDLQPSGGAGVVVCRTDSYMPNVSDTMPSFVIEKIVTEYNEEESEVMPKIYGWQNNKFDSYYIDKDVSVIKSSGLRLGFGDVIRFYEEDGIIKKMTIDFDADENVFGRNEASGVPFNTGNQNLSYFIGRAFSQEDGYIFLTDGIDTSFEFSSLRNFPVGTNYIAIVDMTCGKIKTGSLSDIGTYKTVGDDADTVLLRQRQMTTQCCFIYVR